MDKAGHVIIEHVGSESLHEPLARHVLVSDPDIEYPVSQAYVASLL